MKRRVGVYLRVSTDGQTTENQRRELEAVAARSGWEVVGVYEDAGISGSNGQEKRPGLDSLLKSWLAACRHQSGTGTGGQIINPLGLRASVRPWAQQRAGLQPASELPLHAG
jgi:hypothetical protein